MQVLIRQLKAVQPCYPNVDYSHKNWNFWSTGNYMYFEKFTRQIWDNNLVKVVFPIWRSVHECLKGEIIHPLDFCFQIPLQLMFHINRSVLMAGILNEVLFMVVWRIHSLYPQSYHMNTCISFWQIMHTLLSKNRLFAVKHDMNVT